MPWLPTDFAHPTRLELRTGHHLRPIRESDTELDYPAVMGSRERLWSIYGQSWGWPPATMTYEEDRLDLARYEREIEAHKSFNYAVFDRDETELCGCVYIDPTTGPGSDAEISWWVVDGYADTDLEHALDDAVPKWIADVWPFGSPGYPFRAGTGENR